MHVHEAYLDKAENQLFVEVDIFHEPRQLGLYVLLRVQPQDRRERSNHRSHALPHTHTHTYTHTHIHTYTQTHTDTRQRLSTGWTTSATCAKTGRQAGRQARRQWYIGGYRIRVSPFRYKISWYRLTVFEGGRQLLHTPRLIDHHRVMTIPNNNNNNNNNNNKINEGSDNTDLLVQVHPVLQPRHRRLQVLLHAVAVI